MTHFGSPEASIIDRSRSGLFERLAAYLRRHIRTALDALGNVERDALVEPPLTEPENTGIRGPIVELRASTRQEMAEIAENTPVRVAFPPGTGVFCPLKNEYDMPLNFQTFGSFEGRPLLLGKVIRYERDKDNGDDYVVIRILENRNEQEVIVLFERLLEYGCQPVERYAPSHTEGKRRKKNVDGADTGRVIEIPLLIRRKLKSRLKKGEPLYVKQAGKRYPVQRFGELSDDMLVCVYGAGFTGTFSLSDLQRWNGS